MNVNADPQTALTSAVYDALVTFNKTEHWPQLRRAQVRQQLAEHIAAQVTLSLTGLPAVPAAVGVVSAAPDQADLRQRIADAMLTARRTGYEGAARHEEHRYDARCALCAPDVEALADAVLAVLPPAADQAAEVANLRAMYNAVSTREHELIEERDRLLEAPPADRAAVYAEVAEERDEQEAQANLDALAPIAEGAPLPDLDGPALYEALVGMFSGPLPWPPDNRPDLVTLRERIAEDLYAHDHPGWRVPLRESDVEPVYRERAVAVLAGLRRVAAEAQPPLPRCTCGETACESELCDCDSAPCPVDHVAEAQKQPDTETPTESTLYQVVGDWGVEGADEEEEARAAVASWLADHPHSGAHAQQRIYREWPDGSEYYGPWTDLPDEQPADGARQDGAQTQETDRVVAYRSPGGHYLYCTQHAGELGASWTPQVSDDLPDGGLCAKCGVDVLIPQEPQS